MDSHHNHHYSGFPGIPTSTSTPQWAWTTQAYILMVAWYSDIEFDRAVCIDSAGREIGGTARERHGNDYTVVVDTYRVRIHSVLLTEFVLGRAHR